MLAQRLSQPDKRWTMPCQNLTSLTTALSFPNYSGLEHQTDPIIDTFVDTKYRCLIWRVWVKGVNDCQQPIYERVMMIAYLKRHPTSTKRTT